MRSYYVFSEKFFRIIGAPSLKQAVQLFESDHPGEVVISSSECITYERRNVLITMRPDRTEEYAVRP